MTVSQNHDLHIRRPEPILVMTFGLLFSLIGLCLRIFARSLAWPARWEYSGARENTPWAYAESCYHDLGLVLLIFGLALIWLAIARWTDTWIEKPSPTAT
jgi:hypothetical protein